MNLDDIRALSGRPAELCRKYGIADFDLQDDLQRLFGRRADLVAKDGLHRVISDEVLAGAQVLYAA